MNRAEFESELREQGYQEIADRRMSPHEGEMTIRCDGEERTYRAGESFAMTAGRRHTERCGPEGVRYLAGRRYPPMAAG